jgi:murein DD-endopeptidase MepM/ murein hydrolase activator NlpD
VLAVWRGWRAVTLATLVVISGTAVSANADTAVRRVLNERHATVQRVHELKRFLIRRAEYLRAERAHAARLLAAGPRGGGDDLERWQALRQGAEKRLFGAKRQLRQIGPWVEKRIKELRAMYQAKQWWLGNYGVFRACPAPDHTQIFDDFGEMVRLPNVPVHRHMGSDILAPLGSPIRAPFDGLVVSGWSELGGRELYVRGPLGYVYNAHVLTVVRTGYVKAGTVIGTVGATGDATAPHVHLEWHPGNGPAVDPYALIVNACVDVPEEGP